MIKFLLLVNALIFTLLALLHVYWVIGGRWAAKAVIPTDSNGRPVFKRSGWATVLVATSLFIFAVIDLAYVDLSFKSNRSIAYGVLCIGILFVCRAVGDFRYVGFFKRYTNGSFAKMDLLLYSPLCLFIGSLQLAVFYIG